MATEFLAGCRQCVHQASATYMFDEALGCARVKLQYGDDDQRIEVNLSKFLPIFDQNVVLNWNIYRYQLTHAL